MITYCSLLYSRNQRTERRYCYCSTKITGRKIEEMLRRTAVAAWNLVRPICSLHMQSIAYTSDTHDRLSFPTDHEPILLPLA